MSDDDQLRRFLFERFPVRGEVVRLNEAWSAVPERGAHPPVVRALLGEALTASALLASTLKFDGTLTLQIQGGAGLELLVVQCTSELALRGAARSSGDSEDFASLVQGGRLAITLAQAEAERYQSVVPLSGASLSECLEGYFARSEQLPTRLWLSADDRTAAGFLLQRLPDQGNANVDTDGWRRVQMLAETVQPEEIAELPSLALLHRLFHEEQVRVFEPSRVRFRCGCNRDRIEHVLRGLGRDALAETLREQGTIRVRCEFCNRAYVFDRVDAEALSGDAAAHPSPDNLH